MLKGFSWESTLLEGLGMKQPFFGWQHNLSRPGHGLAVAHLYQPEPVAD